MKEMSKSSEEKPLWLGLCRAWRAVVQARRAGGSLGDTDQCEGRAFVFKSPPERAETPGPGCGAREIPGKQQPGAALWCWALFKQHFRRAQDLAIPKFWASSKRGRRLAGRGSFSRALAGKKQKVCGHWKRGWVTREGCRDAL